MDNWLKKHFLPHEHNEHRPHVLRNEGMRRVIILIIALELVVFIIPSLSNLNLSGGMAAVLPTVLGDLTNERRQSENLPVLEVNPLLNLAAQMKAQDMASKSYFAHTSPEGLTPWYWINLAGYKYQHAGENLAVNFSDSHDVTQAWMNSPTHRANIVKGKYTEMGTGVARGFYKGRETVFVAQVYGNPLPKSFTVSPVAVPVKTIVQSAPKISSQVLGSEVIVLEQPEPETMPKVEEKIILPATVASQPTLWQKIIFSPRHTINILLSFVFIIIAFILMLYILIRMKKHEKDLLGNGLAMIAIIGAFMVANYYLSFGNMIVSDTFHYSVLETNI